MNQTLTVNENETTDDLAYLEHLTNHQQDDLLRKFFINKRTLTPVARCADCSMKTYKNCTIMAAHKSFAAHTFYKRMRETMKIINIDGKKKIQCQYVYREDVETKFAAAN